MFTIIINVTDKFEERSIKANYLDFKNVKATAKAHKKSHRKGVTFVLIKLTVREFWTSRMVFRN